MTTSCTQPGPWPADLDLRTAPTLVRELARDGIWLEQERLTLHADLIAELIVVATTAHLGPMARGPSAPTRTTAEV